MEQIRNKPFIDPLFFFNDEELQNEKDMLLLQKSWASAKLERIAQEENFRKGEDTRDYLEVLLARLESYVQPSFRSSWISRGSLEEIFTADDINLLVKMALLISNGADHDQAMPSYLINYQKPPVPVTSKIQRVEQPEKLSLFISRTVESSPDHLARNRYTYRFDTPQYLEKIDDFSGMTSFSHDEFKEMVVDALVQGFRRELEHIVFKKK